MRKSMLIVAALILVGGAVQAGESAKETLTHQYALPEGASLVVENLVGTLEIRGGGSPGVVGIEAEVVANAKTAEEAEALAESIDIARHAGDNALKLRVSYPVDKHTEFHLPRSERGGLLQKWVAPLISRSKVSVDYDGRIVEVTKGSKGAAVAAHVTITLPKNVDARFRQIVGTIDCARLRGNLDFEVVQGSVLTVQTDGRIRARTGGGRVVVKNFHGDELGLMTGSGDIEMVEVNAKELDLQTGSGAIRGEVVRAGAARVTSGSGNVALEDVESKSYEVTTDSGSVNLATRLNGTREALLTTGSGDVTLRIGELTQFDLEASSKEVKTKGLDWLEVLEDGADGETRLRKGSGGAQVRISTASGGVTLKTM